MYEIDVVLVLIDDLQEGVFRQLDVLNGVGRGGTELHVEATAAEIVQHGGVEGAPRFQKRLLFEDVLQIITEFLLFIQIFKGFRDGLGGKGGLSGRNEIFRNGFENAFQIGLLFRKRVKILRGGGHDVHDMDDAEGLQGLGRLFFRVVQTDNGDFFHDFLTVPFALRSRNTAIRMIIHSAMYW